MTLRWISDDDHSIGFPHPQVPLLLGSPRAWKAWRGRREPEESFNLLDGVVGEVESGEHTWFALPGEEQGAIHIGISDDSACVLHWFGDEDDSGELEARKRAIEAGEAEEYLAGTADVDGGLMLGNAWTAGAKAKMPAASSEVAVGNASLFAFKLPRDRYLVLEGGDDDSECRWLRICRGSPDAYGRRPEVEIVETPEEVARDLLHQLEHVKVGDKKLGGATSPADLAVRIVELGHGKLLEDRAAAVEAERPAFAAYLRILTRAARGEDATADVTTLAEEWLAPAASTQAASQVLMRADILAAIAALPSSPSLVALRQRVTDAPEPEPYMPDGDFF